MWPAWKNTNVKLKMLASSLQPCTCSSPTSIQGKLPEEHWTSSNIHFREYESCYVGGKVVRSLASFTNGTQPMWRAFTWSRAYVDGMEMPQQTEDWHRALQGTPLQMGILEGQPRSKLWLWLWAPYHAALTPVSFVGASMHSWKPRSL